MSILYKYIEYAIVTEVTCSLFLKKWDKYNHFLLWFMSATKLQKVRWQVNTLNWWEKTLRNIKKLHIWIQWLIVKLPQFWRCLLLLTVMPSTIFEIISKLFFVTIHFFSLKYMSVVFWVELLKPWKLSSFQFQNKIEVGMAKDIFLLK